MLIEMGESHVTKKENMENNVTMADISIYGYTDVTR
jgi:hypothetical protein